MAVERDPSGTAVRVGPQQSRQALCAVCRAVGDASADERRAFAFSLDKPAVVSPSARPAKDRRQPVLPTPLLRNDTSRSANVLGHVQLSLSRPARPWVHSLRRVRDLLVSASVLSSVMHVTPAAKVAARPRDRRSRSLREAHGRDTSCRGQLAAVWAAVTFAPDVPSTVSPTPPVGAYARSSHAHTHAVDAHALHVQLYAESRHTLRHPGPGGPGRPGT